MFHTVIHRHWRWMTIRCASVVLWTGLNRQDSLSLSHTHFQVTGGTHFFHLKCLAWSAHSDSPWRMLQTLEIKLFSILYWPFVPPYSTHVRTCMYMFWHCALDFSCISLSFTTYKIHTHMHTHRHTHEYTHKKHNRCTYNTQEYTHAHTTHIIIHTYKCIHTPYHVHVYTHPTKPCMYIHMDTSTHLHIHTYTHAYTYVHVHKWT